MIEERGSHLEASEGNLSEGAEGRLIRLLHDGKKHLVWESGWVRGGVDDGVHCGK